MHEFISPYHYLSTARIKPFILSPSHPANERQFVRFSEKKKI